MQDITPWFGHPRKGHNADGVNIELIVVDEGAWPTAHLRHLRHIGESPGFAPVLLVGSHDDGRRYAVTQRLDDPTLDEVVLTWDEYVQVIEQAARALHEAHLRGVYHGALSPSDIHIVNGDDVAVAGVGLGLGGEPPESEWVSEGHGVARDVWSLGQMLAKAPDGAPAEVAKLIADTTGENRTTAGAMATRLAAMWGDTPDDHPGAFGQAMFQGVLDSETEDKVDEVLHEIRADATVTSLFPPVTRTEPDIRWQTSTENPADGKIIVTPVAEQVLAERSGCAVSPTVWGAMIGGLAALLLLIGLVWMLATDDDETTSTGDTTTTTEEPITTSTAEETTTTAPGDPDATGTTEAGDTTTTIPETSTTANSGPGDIVETAAVEVINGIDGEALAIDIDGQPTIEADAFIIAGPLDIALGETTITVRRPGTEEELATRTIDITEPATIIVFADRFDEVQIGLEQNPTGDATTAGHGLIIIRNLTGDAEIVGLADLDPLELDDQESYQAEVDAGTAAVSFAGEITDVEIADGERVALTMVDGFMLAQRFSGESSPPAAIPAGDSGLGTRGAPIWVLVALAVAGVAGGLVRRSRGPADLDL